MIRLNVVVEGSTEEAFIKALLMPHLAALGIFVSVRKIRTGWSTIHNKPAKGGLISYIQFKNDVSRWFRSEKNNTNCWYTSMVDFYKFPVDDSSPYNQDIKNIRDVYLRIEALEKAILTDMGVERFIPYVQLHEFETLLFAGVDYLPLMFPDDQNGIARLEKEIKTTENIEMINETETGAPSKRIIKHIPAYENVKAQAGPFIAEEIGLEKLRSSCAHFNQWIEKLEGLGSISKYKNIFL